MELDHGSDRILNLPLQDQEDKQLAAEEENLDKDCDGCLKGILLVEIRVRGGRIWVNDIFRRRKIGDERAVCQSNHQEGDETVCCHSKCVL